MSVEDPNLSKSLRDGVPNQRSRAPTITIDTTAASGAFEYAPSRPTLVGRGSNADPSFLQDSSSMSSKSLQLQSSSSALKEPPPIGPSSMRSKPVPAHDDSSSTRQVADLSNTFLSVPGPRSRANSLDSYEEYQPNHLIQGGNAISSLTDKDKRAAPQDSYDNTNIMKDREALRGNPGEEEDFLVSNNKFAFSPGQLSKLFMPKSLAAFFALGGLEGIEKGLRSNRQGGLNTDEQILDGTITYADVKPPEVPAQPPELSVLAGRKISVDQGKVDTELDSPDRSFFDRKRVFGDNRLPEKKGMTIWELAWTAYNDKVLILLSIAAVISLALGLYQTFRPQQDGEARIQWVEGVAIMAAIIIVVVVGAANDWQKERQFIRLNRKKEDRTVKVIRSGRSQEISVFELLAGDVMHLEPGDLVPADGIFIGGHNVKCDESSTTGESDLLRKHPGDQVFQAIRCNENTRKLDPFIISGSTVCEGVGTFLVTAVGVHSCHGKTMMSLRVKATATPLQSKLNDLADYIAKLGLAAALLLFVAALIKFLAKLPHNPATPAEKGQNFLNILIVAITVVVVAVPEGLPLAVTLALAFATTRMIKDNNLVRILQACETMGNATTVCSDKTGTLTQNKMTVVAGIIGTSCRFSDRSTAFAENDHGDGPLNFTARECMSVLAPEARMLLEQSIAINSTAFEGEGSGKPTFIGSKTETALLGFARDHLAMNALSEVRSNAAVVQFIPFNSGRKCMGAVEQLENGNFRFYVKGASEILLASCSEIPRDPTSNLATTLLSQAQKDYLSQVITTYASQSLRTIGLVYRDFDQWPPRGVRVLKDDPTQASFDDIFKRMIFLAIVGIQDPLRDGVEEAVKNCLHAGVVVRMVTGDNVMTARAIAEECGIHTPEGIILEGPQFRRMSRIEMQDTIPRLQVLARSSPEDKRILVKRLKEMGETVAVTGDGTNDAPALKTADVGFSMGIAGTEVAKEASAIILMDDNFASIVKAIMWGRAVNDAVQKFLQFQITVNITAVVLTFVSAIASDTESSVLTAVQLLWVNLIMDTFAALALATDSPPRSILDRQPTPKSAPLITLNMWKMIIGQAIYQLAVTLVLHFAGAKILSYQTPHEFRQLNTLVFNTFVWMQIFNQYNNRRLDNKFNIFEGIHRNWFFIGINVIIVSGQIMIIFVGGRAFSVIPLNGVQWGYSILLGAISLPVAMIIRLIPDELFGKLIPDSWSHRSTPEDEDKKRIFQWNPALQDIREELVFLRRLKGGRLNQLKFAISHPREFVLQSTTTSRRSSVSRAPSGDEIDSASQLQQSQPSQAPDVHRRSWSRSNSVYGVAAMAGVIAGSVGGWSPIDPAHANSASSGVGSDQGGIES